MSSQKCDNGICTVTSCRSSTECFPSEKCKGIKGRDIGVCYPTNCKDRKDCVGSQKCVKGICTVRPCKHSKQCLVPFETCRPSEHFQDGGLCFPTPCKVNEGIKSISFELNMLFDDYLEIEEELMIYPHSKFRLSGK